MRTVYICMNLQTLLDVKLSDSYTAGVIGAINAWDPTISDCLRRGTIPIIVNDWVIVLPE